MCEIYQRGFITGENAVVFALNRESIFVVYLGMHTVSFLNESTLE